MKWIGATIAAVMLWSTIVGAQGGSEMTVESMPPSVVKTVPQAGDTNVDPSLREVSATFSKDMMTEEMWSWAMDSEKTFPKIDPKKIHYLPDKRTCVMPVTLEPNKTYVIWINSQKYTSFRDKQNHPAIPYLLTFQTGDRRASSGSAEEKAAAVAKSWLSLIDSGKYVKSWQEAAQYLKGAVAKEQWPGMIKPVRVPLGKVVSRKVKSKDYMTQVPGLPDGKYVVIQFETSFENKKSAIETVTPMLDKDGKWRVSGYYIK